jgi:hypothetical protein
MDTAAVRFATGFFFSTHKVASHQLKENPHAQMEFKLNQKLGLYSKLKHIETGLPIKID